MDLKLTDVEHVRLKILLVFVNNALTCQIMRVTISKNILQMGEAHVIAAILSFGIRRDSVKSMGVQNIK